MNSEKSKPADPYYMGTVQKFFGNLLWGGDFNEFNTVVDTAFGMPFWAL